MAVILLPPDAMVRPQIIMEEKFMKKIFVVAGILTALLAGQSCRKSGAGQSDPGTLMFRFDGNPRELSKVSQELPDTNDFLITVTDGAGAVIFDDVYCNLPEKMEVAPGSYGIFVRSEDFSGLEFSMPQYGDQQCVVVQPSGEMTVKLGCRQINSGIRLQVSPEFLTEFPDGVLFVKAGGRRLMYSYTEKRIAYFEPGSVSVILSNAGQETVLLTRTLVSQEILTLKVSVSASGGTAVKGISISLDTSRVWTNETYVLGGEDAKGSSFEDALTVSQALASVGREDVWVSGFIVGGDLTSANASFSAPFKSASNILLGPRSSSSSRDNCLAVQLPSGDVRDALNLADHPEMLGRLVCINGDIVDSYYGLTGLKSVSDFVLK